MLKKGTCVPASDKVFYFFSTPPETVRWNAERSTHHWIHGSLDLSSLRTFRFVEQTIYSFPTTLVMKFPDLNNSRIKLLQEDVGNSILSIYNLICFLIKVQLGGTLSCKIHTLWSSSHHAMLNKLMYKESNLDWATLYRSGMLMLHPFHMVIYWLTYHPKQRIFCVTLQMSTYFWLNYSCRAVGQD